MALPKPQLNGDVLEYDELQTDEINKIADYVVEIGVSGRSEYTKYSSGRIKIKQISRINGNNKIIDLDFPIIPASTDKPRFCFVQMHDYDVTNTKNVLSSCFEGIKVRIGSVGITGATDVCITVDAWWK